MRHWRCIGAALAVLIVLVADPARAQTTVDLERSFADALTTIPTGALDVTGSFYVPAYSSVSMSQGKLRADFSVTLSIHNASEAKPLVLNRIAYFDGNGKQVDSYLKRPIALKPFGTVDIYIPELDVRAGTGANFIVDWASAGEIAEPVVETLMFGSVGNRHFSFVSQGRAIKIVGGK
ncbi:MAG TPA: DUF3124 domain-containing protein [Xanthobacteraceae bacterium]|nr:DUF3124 domain-containing protein [Xanthobacteraceae bacterium]